MTNAYLGMPLDGIGKKVDAVSLTVGGNLVHQQRVIARSHERTLTTRYWFNTGSLVVGAAADAAITGRVYIENDVDSSVLIAVTRVVFTSQHASVLATPTSPRIALRTFTFTQSGSPSGATIAGAKQDSTLPNKNAKWDVRTAKTLMTVTEAADIAIFYPVSALTAVAASTPARDEWVPGADRPLIVRPGEGLMVKQADAGTASDTRVFALSFEIEEFTVAA
jgi:hypothetical protein